MQATLLDWGTPVGLVLTMLGIITGIFRPTVIDLSYNLGRRDQRRARIRYWISFVLILVGTASQVYPSLPQPWRAYITELPS